MGNRLGEWTSCGLSLILVSALFLEPISLGAVGPDQDQVVLETKGYIVPVTQVTVSPKVSGSVVEMAIEQGKRVKAGDMLARLDPREYEVELRLARPKQMLDEAELAKVKDGAGLPGTSKADLAIAQAKVEVAQAQVDLAQHRLECTVIRAPINGTVLAKRADVGSLIDPKAYQVPASLCDLADLRTVDVEIWVQERDLALVAKGQSCLVRLESFPGTTYRGRVARLVPNADRARGAVGLRVRVEVPEADDHVRPELSAIVQIRAKK